MSIKMRSDITFDAIKSYRYWFEEEPDFCELYGVIEYLYRNSCAEELYPSEEEIDISVLKIKKAGKFTLPASELTEP